MEQFGIPEEHKRAIKLFLLPPIIGGVLGSLAVSLAIRALGL